MHLGQEMRVSLRINAGCTCRYDGPCCRRDTTPNGTIYYTNFVTLDRECKGATIGVLGNIKYGGLIDYVAVSLVTETEKNNRTHTAGKFGLPGFPINVLVVLPTI